LSPRPSRVSKTLATVLIGDTHSDRGSAVLVIGISIDPGVVDVTLTSPCQLVAQV
jgi:hypothetical protein